jgi:hypothetical protein
MNPQALLSALPWVRRAWRMMPPALRVPVLLVAAAAGAWYALESRQQLQQLQARDRRGA